MTRAVAAALLLALSPSAAVAWEARTSAICEIVHAGPAGDVRITYDPASDLYGITVARAAPWSTAPVFSIQFGATGLIISTDRHELSEGGTALTVTDTGFGNVLRGLEIATTATALSGDTSAIFDLSGAPEAVAEFRACTSAPSV